MIAKRSKMHKVDFFIFKNLIEHLIQLKVEATGTLVANFTCPDVQKTRF